MSDEYDDLGLGDLEELDDLEPSDPAGGSNSQPRRGDPTFAAIRKIGKAVRTLNEKVDKAIGTNNPPETPPTIPPVPLSTPPANDELEQRVDLRMQGYSPEEIAFIKQNQKPGQSLFEAAKDPFVTAAIEKTREKKVVEEATPTPSSINGIPVPEGKKMKDVAEDRGAAMSTQDQLIEQNRKKRQSR